MIKRLCIAIVLLATMSAYPSRGSQSSDESWQLNTVRTLSPLHYVSPWIASGRAMGNNRFKYQAQLFTSLLKGDGIHAYDMNRDGAAVLQLLSNDRDLLIDNTTSPAEAFYKINLPPELGDRLHVYRKGNRTIGFIKSFRPFPDEAHIGLLAVASDQRGKGYGKLLMLSELKSLKQKNIPTVSLYVKHDNDLAQRLYHRMGFRTLCLVNNSVFWMSLDLASKT